MTEFDIKTQNKDAGATLLLWFFSDFKTLPEDIKRITVKDAPFFNCEKNEEALVLGCPQNFLEVTQPVHSQLLHKIKWKLRLASSPFDLNQDALVNLYVSMRQKLQPLLNKDTGSCRLLVRVDDFPSIYQDSEDFVRFHEVMTAHKIPYLLGVTPFLDRGKGSVPLTDRELGLLQRCRLEGASFALHGFTHKSRIAKYNSELVSMPAAEMEEKLDQALSYFHENRLPVSAFIAPFNTYDPATMNLLTKYFPLICGGPESVLSIGRRIGPSFLNQSVYLPSYNGVYDLKQKDLSRLDNLIKPASHFVLPLTLHWSNGMKDDFKMFKELASRFQNHILSWDEFESYTKPLKEAMLQRK